MARTKTIAPLSPEIPETQHSPNKNSRSKTSSSRKKHHTTKMDTFAIQPVSHSTAPDFSMDNNPDGPIAIKDYLDGLPMLLPLEERARLAAEPTQLRQRRRLLEDNEYFDSNGSQGGRPSHASVSLPSTYHDVSPDPAHIADSTTHTPSNSPTAPKPATSAECVPPPTRLAPALHQPPKPPDLPPQAPAGQSV